MDVVPSQVPRRVARRGIDRTWLPIYIAVGVIALLFIPYTYLGGLMLIALAGNLIRSALIYRGEGWISGLILGLLLLSPVILGLIALAVRVVRG
jgi:hypothetical protein